MLLSELLLAMAWFNPLVYLYRKTILNNLEYIADRGVLDTGLQLNTYIRSILCETMGAETVVLANHFRTSQNKLRLKMMKNVKQSKWGKYKLLLVLPIVGGLCWAFSKPEYIAKQEPQQKLQSSKVERNELVKGAAVIMDTVLARQSDGTYTTQIVAGRVSDVNVVIKGTTLGTFTDEKNGDFQIKVTKGDILVFSHVGYKTREVKYTGQKEIMAPMTQVSYRTLNPEKYRKKYKGKMVPPPPPPITKKGETVPPPPPPPSDKESYFAVEELASYLGGMDGYFANLYTYITQLKKNNDLQGTIKVMFSVDTDGSLKDIKALNRSGDKEAEHAMHIISQLKDWKPATQRGKPIKTNLVVPVEFN